MKQIVEVRAAGKIHTDAAFELLIGITPLLSREGRPPSRRSENTGSQLFQ